MLSPILSRESGIPHRFQNLTPVTDERRFVHCMADLCVRTGVETRARAAVFTAQGTAEEISEEPSFRLYCKILKGLAGTTGLEPAASAVTGQRSNQLNYVPTCFSYG